MAKGSDDLYLSSMVFALVLWALLLVLRLHYRWCLYSNSFRMHLAFLRAAPLWPTVLCCGSEPAMYFGMKFAYDCGYSLGSSAVEALVNPESGGLSVAHCYAFILWSLALLLLRLTSNLNIACVIVLTTLNGIFSPKVLNLLFVYSAGG